MNYVECTKALTDKVNLIGGLIIAVLSCIFGPHWFLFLAFLLLNIGDYVTGIIRSRLSGVVSSTKGLNGALKKLAYWIMILLAFGVSVIFIEVGEIIGVDLQITQVLGWLVLASLIINEIRSILENLVEAGIKVPVILTSGLEVADKILEKKSSEESSKEEN